MARRNTRERILETALALFNDAGVAQVSTNSIADEAEISPGNLYYHFRSKDDIVAALFGRYEEAVLATLAVPGERLPDLEDTWFFLHTLFEVIAEYRFIYRNFSDIVEHQQNLNKRFRAILDMKAHTAATFIAGLSEAGIMTASTVERAALARNIVVLTTCWLSFARLQPELYERGPDLAVWQVISLVSPFLRQPERAQLERLARSYLRGF
ncbi:MAG: TetR/AcrR family transcriptional regulator [Wenzhouxiangellaceae bacterium]